MAHVNQCIIAHRLVVDVGLLLHASLTSCSAHPLLGIPSPRHVRHLVPWSHLSTVGYESIGAVDGPTLPGTEVGHGWGEVGSLALRQTSIHQVRWIHLHLVLKQRQRTKQSL